MAKTTPPDELEKLRAEVARLEGVLKAERSANEEASLRAAYVTQDNSERPTGKKVKVPKLKGYKHMGFTDEGKPIRHPEWEEVEVPTFFYKVEMPPVGGVSIGINGNALFNGQVYEFTTDELRVVKDIVHRLKAHEASLNGTNENAYRKPTEAQFSGKVNARVH